MRTNFRTEVNEFLTLHTSPVKSYLTRSNPNTTQVIRKLPIRRVRSSNSTSSGTDLRNSIICFVSASIRQMTSASTNMKNTPSLVMKTMRSEAGTSLHVCPLAKKMILVFGLKRHSCRFRERLRQLLSSNRRTSVRNVRLELFQCRMVTIDFWNSEEFVG